MGKRKQEFKGIQNKLRTGTIATPLLEEHPPPSATASCAA
jgi:hypothetical protein